MEAGQGLGVLVGLQTDGTLNLFLQQLQGLRESPVGEKDYTTQYQKLGGRYSNIQYNSQKKWAWLVISLKLTSLARGLQPFLNIFVRIT